MALDLRRLKVQPPRTRVVHVSLAAYDVYIGRAGYGLGDGYFGNYERGATKEERVRNFRVRFLARMRTDPVYRARVETELRGKVLGCFCKDAQGQGLCHGDVYVEYFHGPQGEADAR